MSQDKKNMPIWKRTTQCSCGNIEDRDIDAPFVIRDRGVIYQEQAPPFAGKPA